MHGQSPWELHVNLGDTSQRLFVRGFNPRPFLLTNMFTKLLSGTRHTVSLAQITHLFTEDPGTARSQQTDRHSALKGLLPGLFKRTSAFLTDSQPRQAPQQASSSHVNKPAFSSAWDLHMSDPWWKSHRRLRQRFPTAVQKFSPVWSF